MSGILTLDLPYPPTANLLWRNFRGRTVKSEKYRAWEALALAEVAVQGAGHGLRRRFVGPYALRIAVGRPDNRRRDIDNIIKPTNDLLVKAGIVADDSDCQRVEASWVESLVGLRVTIVETARVGAAARRRISQSAPRRECAGDGEAAVPASPDLATSSPRLPGVSAHR